jgi:DNA-binding CsgD family transcriptional regulator
LFLEGVWSRIQQSLNLSPREAEILFEILQDQKETTIAEHLAISPHTVHAHLERLYRKLGVSSRVQLIVRVFAEYLALSEGTSRR